MQFYEYSKNSLKNCLYLFILLTICFFFLGVFDITIRIRKILAVESWIATPCEIIEVSPGYSDFDKLSWRIVYDYEYDDISYSSERYHIFEKYKMISNRGKRNMAKNRYKLSTEQRRQKLLPYNEGATEICYVNPKKPSEAVLVKDGPETRFGFLMVISILGSVFCFAITYSIINQNKAFVMKIGDSPD